jgi:hypothetical protein
MNEETEMDAVEDTMDELAVLKQRADIMGIKYHPNIKLESLKAKVAAKLDGEVGNGYEDEEIETINTATKAMAADTFTPLKKETPAQLKEKRKQEALKLVRIRVSCMNPVKANMKGEIFCVGNSEMGMIKKFVPFNAEQGWHVPNIILQEIKNKKFVSHYSTKIGNKTVNQHKLIPEYSIEILDPLTPEELKDLANRQLMSNK